MLLNLTASEWMLIHFIIGIGGIVNTGAFLLFWLYMQDRVEQAILRERSRIFEDSEVVYTRCTNSMVI